MTDATHPDGAAFGIDSAVEALGDGRYRAHVTPSWSAPIGPNGGYIAGMIVRALEAEIGDPDRALRSLTLHYLRSPAVDEDAEVAVAVERAGRSVTSASVRLTQASSEGPCIVGLAALSVPIETALDYSTAMPELPPFDTLEPVVYPDQGPEISRRFDLRYALGQPPFSSADEAVTGGYIRLARPEPYDAALLALMVDAWLPSAWCRLDRIAPAPTIDLTFHFRAPAVVRALAPDTPLAVRFHSTTSRDGLYEEDAEVWSPDGVLLAQGRQLALLRPLRTEPS